MTDKIQQVTAYKVPGYPDLCLSYEEAAEIAMWTKLSDLFFEVYSGSTKGCDATARQDILEFITNNPHRVLNILCDYVDKKL